VNNVVSYDPPLGFDVPECEHMLEEAMMLVQDPRVIQQAILTFEGAHLLLGLRVNEYYQRSLNMAQPMMTIGRFP
jgi:hypothetical protein